MMIFLMVRRLIREKKPNLNHQIILQSNKVKMIGEISVIYNLKLNMTFQIYQLISYLMRYYCKWEMKVCLDIDMVFIFIYFFLSKNDIYQFHHKKSKTIKSKRLLIKNYQKNYQKSLRQRYDDFIKSLNLSLNGLILICFLQSINYNSSKMFKVALLLAVMLLCTFAQNPELEACISARCPDQYNACKAKSGCEDLLWKCEAKCGAKIAVTCWTFCVGATGAASNVCYCAVNQGCISNGIYKLIHDFIREVRKID